MNHCTFRCNGTLLGSMAQPRGHRESASISRWSRFDAPRQLIWKRSFFSLQYVGHVSHKVFSTQMCVDFDFIEGNIPLCFPAKTCAPAGAAFGSHLDIYACNMVVTENYRNALKYSPLLRLCSYTVYMIPHDIVWYMLRAEEQPLLLQQHRLSSKASRCFSTTAKGRNQRLPSR